MAKREGSPLLVAYLTVYNLLSFAGWIYLMSITVRHLLVTQSSSPAMYWSEVEGSLKVVQTAAALEVLHSLSGMVKSPIGTTFLQVFSRIWVVWGVLAVAPPSAQSVFVYVTVGSWCLVEIPRYLFYALNQLNCVPYPVFWLRYSLFAILYPTGITGELGCTYFTAVYLYNKESDNVMDCVLLFFVLFLALSYLPGAPVMYGHMVKTRKKQFSSPQIQDKRKN